MTDPLIQRLKIKHGQSEFEAEGTQESITAQYALWLELIKERPALPLNQTIVPNTGRVVTDSLPAGLQVSAATINGEGVATGGVSEDVMSRVFHRQDDSVSLLALPRLSDRPDADALVALLYAFQRLLNKPHVTGVALMNAARQSGVIIPRVDNVLKAKADLVMAAGARRGRRYSLNNRGNAYAENLVRLMIE